MERSQQLLGELRRALERLEDALAQPATTDLVRAGCIQYFSFTFELAWKTVRAASRDLGLQDCRSPKACLRQALAQAWIDDERGWLAMLAARNTMAHVYSADAALGVYGEPAEFAPRLRGLVGALDALV